MVQCSDPKEKYRIPNACFCLVLLVRLYLVQPNYGGLQVVNWPFPAAGSDSPTTQVDNLYHDGLLYYLWGPLLLHFYIPMPTYILCLG